MSEELTTVDNQQQEAATELTGQNEEVIQDESTEDTVESQEGEAETTEAQKENDEASEGDKDEDFEKVKWVQKRLKRQEQRHKRELQEFAQAMQTQFMQSLQQGNPMYAPPVAGAQVNAPADSIDEKVNMAVQNVLKKQQEQQQIEAQKKKDEAFNLEAKKLMDKYDDYEDVVNDVAPFFTYPMLFALKNLPGSGLENFYTAWKENPDAVKKIASLPLEEQALAMARLDAEISLKYRNQSTLAKSNPQKPITPLKPMGRSVQDPLSNDYASMIEGFLKK